MADLNDIRQDTWAWGALGADLVCAALPVVTDVGLGVKTIKAANEMNNAAELIKGAEKTIELANHADNIGTVLNTKR